LTIVLGASTLETIKSFFIAQPTNEIILSAERIVEYSPLIDRAQLQVVTKGATGVATTYFFEVTKKEKVWVSIPENLVYIPVKCSKKQPGDDKVLRIVS
jgi:hypothetical protein